MSEAIVNPGSFTARGLIHAAFGGRRRGLNSARENAHAALLSLDPPRCTDHGPHTADCDKATGVLVEVRMNDALRSVT